MKKNIISLSIILLTIPFLFLSCITDKTMSEADKEMHKEALRTAIVGKWLFDGSNLRTAQTANAYLEFFKNETYVLVDAAGKVTSGVYSVKDLDNIELENYGSLQNIVINNTEALFTIVHQNKQTRISAERAQELSENTKTQLLSRTWKMMRVENGVDSLRGGIDSSFVTFESSGTYKVYFFVGGKKRISGENYKWAWHAVLKDRIIYWTDRQAKDEDQFYMIIREMDQNILKTTQMTFGALRNFTFERAQ